LSIHQDTAALARCARKAADSYDGRAHRGAFIEARNALLRTGASLNVAAMAAMAAVRVGQGIAQAAKEATK
jgi:hypothetical protein